MRSRITVVVVSLVLLVPILMLTLGAFAPVAAREPFADARMIIEFNDTDQDVGIQVFLDGDEWKYLKVTAPDGRTLLEINARSNLKELGLTELFFESNEPPLSELPLEEFLALFPEGEYEFFGRTVDGTILEGEAEFTHAIPDGPVLLSPAGMVNPNNTVVSWQPVANPPGSTIVEYQVIVEQVNPKRVFSVHVPASVLSVTVPSQFMQGSQAYKFEVLAIEAGGNQTISSNEFLTSP